MAATVAQKPREMGKIAVEAALKHLKGEAIPEYVPVDLALVKK